MRDRTRAPSARPRASSSSSPEAGSCCGGDSGRAASRTDHAVRAPPAPRRRSYGQCRALATMAHRTLLATGAALALLVAWGLSAAPRPLVHPAATESLPEAGRVALLPPRLHTFAALARERAVARKGPRVDTHAAPPRRIRIPAIGVDAPVIALGLNIDGTLQTPRQWGYTGWYKPGPEPGERGAALITGHVDSTTGPAVFYRLRSLRSGDRIAIRRADGSVVRFRVQGLERWPKSEFPTHRVYGPTRGAVLRLVTCSGDFDTSTGHYVDNTIVYAKRV